MIRFFKQKNREIELVKTCDECPEQYEAFIGKKRVGYLRLRHGEFRVDFPYCGDTTIYEAYPKGQGCFESDEREFYLEEAKKVIMRELSNEKLPDLVEGDKVKILYHWQSGNGNIYVGQIKTIDSTIPMGEHTMYTIKEDNYPGKVWFDRKAFEKVDEK